MAIIVDEKFTINVIGKQTKQQYLGDFNVRVHLSTAQKMQRSRLIREFLGEFAHYATEDDKLRAIAQAECIVSITKSPDWWRAANNGLDLSDDNVLEEVWSGVAKAQGRVKEEADEKTKADAKALKEAVDNGSLANQPDNSAEEE